MSEIKVVELYNIDNQPINEQEQPATDKNMNLVGQNYVPPSVPGATTPQETGMGIARNAVLNIGSLTEYILIDGVGRVIKSSNYVPGVSGWAIKSDGSVEFSNGVFRGDITGASGTFSGTVTGTIANLGGFIVGATTIRDNADSFGLSSAVTGGNDVRFWAGTTTANMAAAPIRIYEDGLIVASNIQATGAINATSGWIGSPTALVYESQGINTGTTGYIRGGQTAFNTGTGYFLGYYSGGYKLSIGDASDTNSLVWDGSSLIVNGSPLTNQDIYGSGSDGAATISGTTTLTGDVYYTNLTINNGVTLYPNGFRIFVRDSLTNNGTISVAGGDGGNGTNGGDGLWSNVTLYVGSGGNGGTAGAAGSGANFLNPGYAGSIGGAGSAGGSYSAGAGSNGTTANSTPIANALIGNGRNGGGGGKGANTASYGGGAASSGGTGGTATLSGYQPKNFTELMTMRDFLASTAVKFTASGGSGSGGGGAGGASILSGGDRIGGGGGGGGGGSGGNGGMAVIVARKVVNTGTITAKGGNGGTGGNGGHGATYGQQAGGGGGGGGGGAGNGGVLVLVYSTLNNSGTITATAGTQGSGGTKGNGGTTSADNGSVGQNGLSGLLIQLKV